MIELTQTIHFEAAHFLPSAPLGHPNSRIHGHSFRLKITIAGEPDPKTQLLMHFDDFRTALNKLHDAVDHRLLNDIEGLNPPTLEKLCVWIWDFLSPDIPLLSQVKIYRDSCGEACAYYGK